MNSIIGWLGGKSRLVKTILPLMPEHKLYCEVFAGAAWVMFGKPPAKAEIVNDINSDLVNLFRVVKHHPEELLRLLNLTPIARDEFKLLKIENTEAMTDVNRAVRFFYLIKNSFSAKGGNFACGCDGRVKMNVEALAKTIRMARERLNKVQLENLPFEDLIPRYDRTFTFFYIDPPYWGHENDYGKGIFRREDFEVLKGLLVNIKGKFMMSINDVPAVRDLFGEFVIREVETRYSAARESSKQVTELLIMNYEPD